jgi:hypothetical protein
MVIAEPRKPYYATDIRSMTSCNERLHGCYLIVVLAEQVTIIITRACVVIGIDESPMPEQRICLGESETVIIQPAFVHTQAVGNSHCPLRFTKRLGCARTEQTYYPAKQSYKRNPLKWEI